MADVATNSQFKIVVEMIFDNFRTKEEFSKVSPLKERTLGEDMFYGWKPKFLQKDLQWLKCIGLSTVNASAMICDCERYVSFCSLPAKLSTISQLPSR